MAHALSPAGLAFIQSFEGYHEALSDGRCKAYQCIVGRDKKGRPIYDGKWTIGWGCTEGVTEGMIWTREQADDAFRGELSRFEVAVNRLVKVPISQHEYDALVSFAYNCGEGKDGLGGSTLLKRLNKGDHAGAAREFGKWVNSNGVKNVPGLVRRRAGEAALFLTPDDPTPLPQTVEASRPVKAAARSSKTIFGGLATLGAVIASTFKDAVEVMVDAAAQMDAIAPAAKVASALGITTTRVTLAIAVTGIALAIYGRLDAARKAGV